MSDLKLNNTNEFNHFNGSECLYKYNQGKKITDGVKYLADTYGCYWFLDMISIQSTTIKNEDFQVWNLKVNNGKATVTVDDGNENILKVIEVPFTDFKGTEVDVYLVDDTILLPKEY